jgi:hypothetical protein
MQPSSQQLLPCPTCSAALEETFGSNLAPFSNPGSAQLRLDPMWDPLRGDPRFQELCEEKQALNTCHFLGLKEARSGLVRHWKIIAANLSKASWSWGCVSAIDSNGRTIWIAAAHQGDEKRCLKKSASEERRTLALPTKRQPPLGMSLSYTKTMGQSS